MARHKQSYSEERHSAPIRVHATPSERQRLQEAADRGGVSLSNFAHELLFRRSAARPPSVAGTRRDPEGAAVLRELNALGINLNQLMRHGHQTGELGPQRLAEVDEALLAIKRAAGRVYNS